MRGRGFYLNGVRGDGSREPSVPSEIRRGTRVVRLSNLDKPYWPDERITIGLASFPKTSGALGLHVLES